jgi:hypothetical protein
MNQAELIGLGISVGGELAHRFPHCLHRGVVAAVAAVAAVMMMMAAVAVALALVGAELELDYFPESENKPRGLDLVDGLASEVRGAA